MISLRALRVSGAVGLLALACARQAPPGVFAGESAHFRLFVDPALTPIPQELAGENGLAALETEWSDVATMLKMPDGKIDYYWLATGSLHAACGDNQESGCTWEDRMEIDAPTLPHAHELNHAYLYLRSHRHPVPFLAEGFADAVGCDQSSTIMDVEPPPILGVVAGVQTQRGLAEEGATLMRHLIRTQGIDRVLRYYEQSPERRDPALFAANFEAFWNMIVEDVWAAAQASTPGALSVDQKICPCSLSPLPTNGALANDPARAPYWTFPDATNDSIAMSAHGGQVVRVRDCAGRAPEIIGQEVIARLGASVGRYVTAPLASATRDHYISDDCTGAAAFHLPPDFLIGSGTVTVDLVVPDSHGVMAQVALDVPSAAHVTPSGAWREIWTAARRKSACQTITPGASLPLASGTLYGTLQLFATASTAPAGRAGDQLGVHAVTARFTPAGLCVVSLSCWLGSPPAVRAPRRRRRDRRRPAEPSSCNLRPVRLTRARAGKRAPNRPCGGRGRTEVTLGRRAISGWAVAGNLRMAGFFNRDEAFRGKTYRLRKRCIWSTCCPHRSITVRGCAGTLISVAHSGSPRCPDRHLRRADRDPLGAGRGPYAGIDPIRRGHWWLGLVARLTYYHYDASAVPPATFNGLLPSLLLTFARE